MIKWDKPCYKCLSHFCDLSCKEPKHLQAPQRKESEQEPVAWKETDEVECPVCKDKGFPWPKCGHITYLEPTPPQRTWVGLTDIEWSDLYEAHHDKYNLPKQGSPDGMDYERAIEAKLKEKNT